MVAAEMTNAQVKPDDVYEQHMDMLKTHELEIEREQERMFNHILENIPEGEERNSLLRQMRYELGDESFSAPPELTADERDAVNFSFCEFNPLLREQ